MPAGFHHRPVAKRNRNFAKGMRHAPTDAERAMWRLLRDRRLTGFKFRRQVPFDNCILDFACFERRLAIEVDGSQHMGAARDRVRDDHLRRSGFRVLRYWTNDVLKQPNAVLEDIFAHLVDDTR